MGFHVWMRLCTVVWGEGCVHGPRTWIQEKDPAGPGMGILGSPDPTLTPRKVTTLLQKGVGEKAGTRVREQHSSPKKQRLLLEGSRSLGWPRPRHRT